MTAARLADGIEEFLWTLPRFALQVVPYLKSRLFRQQQKAIDLFGTEVDLLMPPPHTRDGVVGRERSVSRVLNR